MTDDRDRLIEHYAKMRAELLAAVEGLSEDQMKERSIDGWSVNDHLAHLAAWDEVRASEVARISAGHESAWRMHGAQDATFSHLAHDLRAGLAVAQVRWEIDASRAALTAAIRQATPRGMEPDLYGEAGLVSFHERQHAGWIRAWRQKKGI